MRRRRNWVAPSLYFRVREEEEEAAAVVVIGFRVGDKRVKMVQFIRSIP